MSKLIRKSKKGFTLIELMIVVAIIGILAAIAIPNFLRFQLKAKSSEGKVNIAAIRTAEEGFNAEFGRYVAAAGSPALNTVGAAKVVFTDNGSANANFATLGWEPEGNVFFSYAVAAGTADVFTISATADIDGAGSTQAWGYVKSGSATSLPGVDTRCVIAGVIGAGTNVTDTVGPCVAGHGQSIF